MDKSRFLGLPAATIETLLTAYIAALTAIALGQEYKVEYDGTNRWLTRADLTEVKDTIAELQFAKEHAARGGKRITHTHASFA